jgi:hypothetical protein
MTSELRKSKALSFGEGWVRLFLLGEAQKNPGHFREPGSNQIKQTRSLVRSHSLNTIKFIYITQIIGTAAAYFDILYQTGT